MPQQSAVARVAFAVGIAGLATATLGSPFTVIAESGEQVPGLPAGVVHSFFPSFGINDAGTVAFQARLAGNGLISPSEQAVVVIEGGVTSVMARGNDPASGFDPGVTYSFVGEPTVLDSGTIGWHSKVKGPGFNYTNSTVAYVLSHGVLSPVRFQGVPVNGLPAGIELTSIARVFFGPAGRWVYQGRVAGAGIHPRNDDVVLSDLGDGLPTMVAREGSPAPGFPAGTVFDLFGQIAADSAGRTVFQSSVRNPTNMLGPAEAIFATTDNDGVQPRIASGDPLAGVSGASFQGSRAFSVNEQGRLAISSRLSGSTYSAIVVTADPQQPAIPEAVAVSNEQAGGFAAGVVYHRSFPSDVQINAGGRVAYYASVAGQDIDATNDQALFTSGEASSDDSTPVAIVRLGDRPPGYPLGSIYKFFEVYAARPLIRLNDAGQTAFYAFIESNDLRRGVAIFATDTAGVVRKIIGIGDTVDVGGSVRTVDYVSTAFDLNNNGEVLLIAWFTDGFGALLLATIPPPANPCASIDYALPFGELTFADVSVFLTAFNDQDAAADLADPAGQFTLADVSAFLAAFSAGCP